MPAGDVWFSHREKIWEVNNGKFSWTEKEKIWDWDSCTVSFGKTIDDKLRIVVRSNARVNSTYMGEHLFTWGNIPEDVKEKKKLIQYLKDDHKIEISDDAKIEKDRSGKIVISSAQEKIAWIFLNNKNDNAILKIHGRPAYDLQVKVEKDNIEIYRGKPVELRYMLGFEVDFENIREPETECYIVRNPGKKEGPKLRWVLNLDKDHWIWIWAKDRGTIKDSYIYELYQLLGKESSSNFKKSDNIFDVKVEEKDNKIVPVIYQPAVDALENYLRQIHCAQIQNKEGSIEIEVTLVFNNEQLRNKFLFNRIYQWLREKILYGRKQDIETFKIIVENGSAYFVFKNIYSKKDDKEFDLISDNIHGDKKDAPKRKIKYYFMNSRHPIVFINTSNHAMAENDANHDLWKWEYIPWLENSAVFLGNMTREEVEKQMEEDTKLRSG